MMKIYAVRIGTKYGPEYENYINDKLSEYDIHWIRKPFDPKVKLQWNKMLPMSYPIDKPVCVIDIDIELINDYKQLFEYPVERGQFLSIPGWWKDTEGYTINGGFFKYYPIDCNYIYNKFISDIDYWQDYYIKNGTTVGPVNGEQHFVEDSVKEKLDIITCPPSWVARWTSGYNLTQDQMLSWQFDINKRYQEVSGNNYLHLGQFHEDIKMVHYTHSQNKPVR